MYADVLDPEEIEKLINDDEIEKDCDPSNWREVKVSRELKKAEVENNARKDIIRSESFLKAVFNDGSKKESVIEVEVDSNPQELLKKKPNTSYLQELPIIPKADLVNMNSSLLCELLTKYFGHAAFLPGQEDAIRRILAGDRYLLLLPTGCGKSVAYQFPALFLPGVCVVISPLVALMDDQRAGLPNILKSRAVAWNSGLTAREVGKLMGRLKNGEIKILYISPEKLPSVFNFLTNQLPSPGISFVCVDEAHAVSEWSHNFR